MPEQLLGGADVVALPVGDDGESVLVDPYVSWDEEKSPNGGLRYVLRRIMNYENDERHGSHRAFLGPFGGEVLVEEEAFDNGALTGESRAYYLDGSVREVRRRFPCCDPHVGHNGQWRCTQDCGPS